MANRVYPLAAGIAETETLEILATAFKKRAYPDAKAITETESMVTILGLNWFLADSAVETEAKGSATAFVRRFPSAIVNAETEISCSHLALWPDPPAPVGTLSCGGQDLHKQTFRQGSSYLINFNVSFAETTLEELEFIQLIFEVTRLTADSKKEPPVFLKTRFGAPGGVIIDTITETENQKFLVTGDIQLRNYQTNFPENQLELNYKLKATNEAISRSSNIQSGSIIFYRD